MLREQLYSTQAVTRLFDEMSASYGVTNFVSSFGFCRRWRRQTIEGIALGPDLVVVDLMTGMGECWHFLCRGMTGSGRIIAIDLSREMCRRAEKHRGRFANRVIELRQEDALCSTVADTSVDRVVAAFGLKTFSSEQIAVLAREVQRILKPEGTYSFVEITVPKSLFLRISFLFYLRYVIPLIGRVCLGNPQNYRMLSVYTEGFIRGEAVLEAFRHAGLTVVVEDLFFGCARRFTGEKTAPMQ